MNFTASWGGHFLAKTLTWRVSSIKPSLTKMASDPLKGPVLRVLTQSWNQNLSRIITHIQVPVTNYSKAP